MTRIYQEKISGNLGKPVSDAMQMKLEPSLKPRIGLKTKVSSMCRERSLLRDNDAVLQRDVS
jgi:hypothetical protein